MVTTFASNAARLQTIGRVAAETGRRVCIARKPACGACTLASICPSYGEGPTDPAEAAKLLKGDNVDELIRLAGIEDAVNR